MNINIYIKIIGVNTETVPRIEINQFEEVALFLDCYTGQRLIKKLRERINLNENIPYDKFEYWKKHGVIQDELTKEEIIEANNLDADIDYLENRPFELLSESRKKEIQTKKEERLRLLDPYYTFSRAIKNELIILKKPEFIEILIKAIVIGEVRVEDIKKIVTTRKGANKKIFKARERYWAYEMLPSEEKSKKKGYGYIGKRENPKVSLRTVASSVASYNSKLTKYELHF